MRLFCLLALFFASTSAFAIPEKDYLRAFETTVQPFYNSGVSGSFTGVGGIQISYRKFDVPGEKGAIVFAPGMGESYLKYAELEYDLTQAGYSVYVIDHRGQGFSGRLVADTEVEYVEDFDDYVTDLKTFVEKVVKAVPHERLLLLTNSMGGTVGAHYLARYPNDFERTVMSAPMMELDTGKFPEPVACAYAAFESWMGRGARFAPGHRGYDFSVDTSCATAVEGKHLRACVVADSIRNHRETAIGGASFKWVLEALKSTRRIRAGLGRDVHGPVLLFQAGHETLIKPGGQDRFCADAPQCSKLEFPDGTHELLMERDEIRDLALAATLDFFGRR